MFGVLTASTSDPRHSFLRARAWKRYRDLCLSHPEDVEQEIGIVLWMRPRTEVHALANELCRRLWGLQRAMGYRRIEGSFFIRDTQLSALSRSKIENAKPIGPRRGECRYRVSPLRLWLMRRRMTVLQIAKATGMARGSIYDSLALLRSAAAESSE